MSRTFRTLWASVMFTSLATCQTLANAWDVNNPPGTRSTASIDNRTGTWMNLDVSPEGNEIVFELLGDIYSMPARGW